MIASNRRVFLNASCIALATAALPCGAQGQYPSKPIRLIVPFPPGGSTDQIARVLSTELGAALGQPIVIDFKPGADGVIAGEAVMRASPDGYTLLMGTATGFSAAPVMHKSIPYDPVADFTPISRIGTFGFFLLVSEDLPVKSIAELISYARSNPGKLNCGTATGTAVMATAQLAHVANLKIVQIPYKGDGPLIVDAIAGHVHMAFAAGGPALPHIRSGKLRALATLMPERSSLLPEVPTLSQAGVNLSITPWTGLFGPRGLPDEVINKLSREMVRIMARGDIRDQLENLSFGPKGSTPSELRSFVGDQLGIWKKVASDAGFRPE